MAQAGVYRRCLCEFQAGWHRRSWTLHKIARISLLLVCALADPMPTGAETPANCSAVGSWITEAAAFVGEATDKAVPDVCIRRAGPDEIKALIAPTVAGRAYDEEARALFVPATGEILLGDDIDTAEPLDRSYIVHELVHAQQFANGVHERAPCVGRLEGEAYAVQAQYLRESGLERDAFLVTILGLLQSACEYTY